MPRAVVFSSPDGKPGAPGKVYYGLRLKEVPKPVPTGSQILVRIAAAALNHRDLFARQQLYPGAAPDIPLLADGVGTVVECGPEVGGSQWLGQRVLIAPMKGWEESVEGPESGRVDILGGTTFYPTGTLQEYLLLDSPDYVVRAPERLSDVEAAALPLAGLTAWRALVTKCGERNSSNGAAVLITGIGGGVALMALQFAVARGALVVVTSGDDAKIEKATALGAVGGVNYKQQGWEKHALELIHSRGLKQFDAIVDGSGSEMIAKSPKLLKNGGVISIYGMTLSPKQTVPMTAVLRNIDVRGTTMGSLKEFRDMVHAVDQSKGSPKPVVSGIVDDYTDLQALDGLWEDMRAGRQFGKLVVRVQSQPGIANERSQL
ncbi:hypothetical protein KEM52_003484 [Ascosphaera acerosa]|nr:hypothetical protein KEM52_003484 [Ascosphaera acerosa]